MTDPFVALQAFQEALLDGRLQLHRGALDPNLFLHIDQPNGIMRLTYAKLANRTVTAFVNFAQCDSIEGIPCFQIGYAVPEVYRNQGRAKEIIGLSIAEMQHGFGKYGDGTFYVEAIVGADNKPSQRVAEQTISAKSVAVTDQFSGVPAFQYVRKIERPAPV